MKNKILISLFLLVFLIGCAGLDYRYQQNMTTNAATWGIIGAATGGLLGAATGINPGKAAILGGVVGAYAGAVNTPSPYGYGFPGGYGTPVVPNGYYDYGGYSGGYGSGVDQAQYERTWYTLGYGGGNCMVAPPGEARIYCERGLQQAITDHNGQIRNYRLNRGW